MSQLQSFEGANNPLLPDIETITGNSGGAAGPDGAGNFNLVADSESGLTVVTDAGTNSATIFSTNSATGTGQTVGAVTADVITFPLGATPGVYALESRIAGFESSTPAGAAFQVFATVRTDGATATLVGVPDIVSNTEAAINIALADVVVSANNAIIQVTGVAALTIDWRADLQYTFRS